MSDLRQLSEADFDRLIDLVANAYPAFNLFAQEDKQRFKQRFLGRREDPSNHFYGLYRDGNMLGSMILYNFTMKLLSTKARAGGVGMVAVDLLHKKESVAKELIAYFLRHYKERGVTLTLLYPFRPDFYKKMGFGYGTKMNQYRVRPAHLPRGKTKEHVAFLQEDDKELLRDCYNRCLERTNGLIERMAFELDGFFHHPEVQVVGCKRDGALRGYMTFVFKPVKPDNPLLNDIVVKEFVYEDRDALSELLTFLHTQFDQIDRIVFNTQDEHFHYLLFDPRNDSDHFIPPVYQESNVQGVGVMYRVIDTPGIFKVLGGHNFGGQSCRLKLSIADSFFPENAGSTIVRFENGTPRLSESGDHDVEVALDVSDFSSLLVGAVDFKSLYRYGLADISDPGYVDTVQKLFFTDAKPVCMTSF